MPAPGPRKPLPAAAPGKPDAGRTARRPLVAGNWKMHGTTEELAAFAAAWRPAPATVEVLLCPPLGYLRQAASLRVRGVQLGAQDVAAAAGGAFTGQHSAAMAKDLGAAFAIVGHSERRRLCGETNAVVAEKFVAAGRAGLVPILCVGETLAERRGGSARGVVLGQLDAVLRHAGAAAFATAVVAYEPVWAIGTGETASPADAQAMHAAIRGHLANVAEARADGVRILYGGSVNGGNAGALFAAPDVDGGLVGGASLDAREFAAICCAAVPPVPPQCELPAS